MQQVNHQISPFKFNNKLAWVGTVLLMIAMIPMIKIALAFVVKLFEVFIQYGFGR